MNAALLMTKMRGSAHDIFLSVFLLTFCHLRLLELPGFMATFQVPWPLLHVEMLPLLLTAAVDTCHLPLGVEGELRN